MAAVIAAINKKKEAKRKAAARQGTVKLGVPSAETEEEPPEWATKSRVGVAWNNFWEKTTLDDKFWSFQPRASRFYHAGPCQKGVGALIVGNFICTIVKLTIDPRELRYVTEFYIVECFFNICFLIELIVNLYAHWFWKFWWTKGAHLAILPLGRRWLTISPVRHRMHMELVRLHRRHSRHA